MISATSYLKKACTAWCCVQAALSLALVGLIAGIANRCFRAAPEIPPPAPLPLPLDPVEPPSSSPKGPQPSRWRFAAEGLAAFLTGCIAKRMFGTKAAKQPPAEFSRREVLAASSEGFCDPASLKPLLHVLNREGQPPLRIQDGDACFYLWLEQRGGKHSLLVQEEMWFEQNLPLGKLELSVDLDGSSEPCPEGWRKPLQGLVRSFLFKQGIIRTPGGSQLFIHPETVKKAPEDVLRLCVGNWPEKALFFDDAFHLQEGEGEGLLKQVVSDLAQSLLDGSEGRTIQVDERGLPTLNETEGWRTGAYRNLGGLLSFAYASGHPLGRMLPDRFFHLLQGQKPPVDGAIRPVADWLEGDAGKREAALKALSFVSEGVEYLGEPEQKREALRYLESVFLPYRLAAKEIANGMDDSLRQAINDLDPEALSERIQGQKLAAKDLVSRMVCRSSHPMVLKKTAWLKEKLHHSLESPTPADIAWAERFLFAVTSERALHAATKVVVEETSSPLCMAHTCSNQLDISTTFEPKEKFFQNLDLLMAQSDYGIR